MPSKRCTRSATSARRASSQRTSSRSENRDANSRRSHASSTGAARSSFASLASITQLAGDEPRLADQRAVVEQLRHASVRELIATQVAARGDTRCDRETRARADRRARARARSVAMLTCSADDGAIAPRRHRSLAARCAKHRRARALCETPLRLASVRRAHRCGLAQESHAEDRALRARPRCRKPVRFQDCSSSCGR